jgi:hypothetical protein
MSSSLWGLPVFRLIATDRCRVAAPWFSWSHSPDRASRLRRLALTLERNRLQGLTALEQALAAIAYLPFSLIAILRAMRQSGRSLAVTYGISRGRQFVDLLNYAWRLGMSPRTYYQFRLHRHPWRSTGRQFIDQPELHHLQRHISPPDIDALEDKVRFAEFSRAHALPLVPILAFWENGQPRSGETGDHVTGLPREPIFIKPAASYSSAGVMGFKYDSETQSYRDEQRDWAPDELAARLSASSRGRTLIVQPWMQNHATLAGFSSEALVNFRIVTARQLDGETLPVMAALRFPWKSRVSCAEAGVTLCASVDLATGVLRAAESKDPQIGRLSRHPLTGQVIEGFKIPDWDRVLRTALGAHEPWQKFPFIGWDVVSTTQGLYILEGSCIWGGYLAQMSGSAPLGATRFPELYLAHLAAREGLTT